jgi:hypothetical protein
MDVSTIATGGGSAGFAVIVLKIIEKVPWGKLIGRPSKNGKGPDENRVKVIVSEAVMEHQRGCQVKTTLETMGEDIREIRSSITQLLLNGGR